MYSNNALKWLEKFIEDRLGIKVKLQQTNDRIFTHLDGEEKTVSITNNSEVFLSKDPPFCYFDVSSFMPDYPISPLIPMPGLIFPPKSLLEKDYNTININYDIYGLIYWSLNRIEEIGLLKTDEHGRFLADQSHAFRYGYIDRPWVDEWLIVLERIFKLTWPSIRISEHQFCIVPSHDVDIPSKYAFTQTQDFLKQLTRDFIRGSKDVVIPTKIRFTSNVRLHKSDSYNTFKYLMDQSEKKNIKSTFFFMTNVSNRQMDSGYDLSYPSIENLLREISQRGHGIGIHPSYETYKNPNLISEELHILITKCESLGIQQSEWGSRMHFLRWQHPVTLQGLSKAGLTYDSTLGYASVAGFRCGTCHPYTAFDHTSHQIVPITLKPLIAMDVSLRGKAYMNLSNEAAILHLSLLKERCKAVKGNFSILWHNSQFEDNESYEIYESALNI